MEWHPFAERFPLLEGEEWKAFKASIKASNGPEVPATYRMVNGRKQGLDGRNRFKACEELGIECPMQKLFLADEDVKEYILRRNVHRRHLTGEQRRELVAELRADGMSTRAIAGTLGVSKSTVANDLSASQVSQMGHLDNETGQSGVQNWTPGIAETQEKARPAPEPAAKSPTAPVANPAPSAVTGRDGKSYPASKPKPPASPPPKPPDREPGDDTDTEEAEQKASAKAKRENGKPAFDDRAVDTAIGQVVKLIDVRGVARGVGKAHTACVAALANFATAWAALKEAGK